ncbi:MAG TPA: hypothetical protein VKH44_06890 [Pirellulaceae bacterium]|nr:hypothetical protein [Pirellulaceae bacterium]
MSDRIAENLAGPFPHSTYPQPQLPLPRPTWLRPSPNTGDLIARKSDGGGRAKPLEELILKYPAAALASAFLVGVAIAWWIKRK